MNVVDWIRETALYMVAQRPDIYDYERASGQLIDHMEYLRTEHAEEPLSSIMSGSFIILRLVEDEGQEEFQVAQYVSSVTTFLPEEDCIVIGNSFLDVNLPSPSDGMGKFDEGLDNEDDG